MAKWQDHATEEELATIADNEAHIKALKKSLAAYQGENRIIKQRAEQRGRRS